MYTINNNSEYELIIKNSRFICLLYKINSPIDVDKYLELVKTKYPQATHYCYAFIINDIKKSSDDKSNLLPSFSIAWYSFVAVGKSYVLSKINLSLSSVV